MTQSELQAGIQEFWRTKMTIKQCRRYVGHIKKVVPNVVKRNGAATGTA